MLHSNNKMKLLAALTATLIAGATLSACQKESNASLLSTAAKHQRQGDYPSAIIMLKNALEQNPDDAQARYWMATVYLDTGDALSAEKEIRLALKLSHPAEAAFPVLARSLHAQGLFQKVLDETAALADQPLADVQTVRADALLALGKRDEAIKLYGQVLAAQPKFVAALIGQGKAAILGRDAEGANKFAALALAAEPGNTDALLFKGDLLRATNLPADALAMYDKVLAISPRHRSAHVEKAYLAISLGKFDDSQKELDIALEIAPGSVLVAYTQSLLDYSRGKHAAAQESILNVLRVAPEHMPSILLAGAICIALNSPNQAEHHLRHYLEKNPDNVHARKMLASTLLQTGHSPAAQAVLAPALKEPTKDVQLLALAGETYMQARDFDKAGEYFEKASVLEPKAASLRTSLALSKLGRGEVAQAISDLQLATRLDAKSHQAGMTLVRTELRLGHVDKATAAVQALEKAQPDNAAVHDIKGAVYLARKDLAQARASFDKALALQPSYFPAAANLAQMALDKKDDDEARKILTGFLDKNKKSTEAMTALAALASRDNKPAEATAWLEKANAVDPAAIAPAVNLVAQYLLAGDNQKALSLARKLQVTNPDNPDLLDLLGKSQLASGERVNAVETYKKLAVALPRSAQAQMQVAALQMMVNNPASAEEFLKTALAIQPDFPAAQLAQAEIYVRKGQFELASLIAWRLQRKYPKAAAGFQLEGDILMVQNKAAQALPVYEQAFGFNKSSELLIKTANALRLTGKQDEASKRLANWIQQNPEDMRALLFKAETLLADKQYKPAAAQLEAALQKQPKNIIALNNLALTYQQLQDQRALATAESAYELAKEQPVVMDTLGWILVEMGDPKRGLEILQRASVQSPQARDIRYHLASAHFKNGNKAAAKKELETLMAGNMQFAQADDAKALFKQLQ